jgi:hypothetical protein
LRPLSSLRTGWLEYASALEPAFSDDPELVGGTEVVLRTEVAGGIETEDGSAAGAETVTKLDDVKKLVTVFVAHTPSSSW